MSEEEELSISPEVATLENGIFNLVVALYRHLNLTYNDRDSRFYVAAHLEKLAYHLRELDLEEGTQDD